MPNGIILWEGPSPVDGAPIVLIATGFPGRGHKTSNLKTGAMIQTWIIRTDRFPSEAIAAGLSSSVCGSCPLQGHGCYVRMDGPSSVYKAFIGYREPMARADGSPNPHAGQTWGPYPAMHPFNAGELAGGVPIRIGSYGDPGMVPLWVWKAFLAGARESGSTHRTGYTHRWKVLSAKTWGRLLMASCDTAEDRHLAQRRGWRTFRIADAPMAGEVLCPASREAGKQTTCARCGLCDGARPGDKRKSIYIPAHGVSAYRIRNREA